MSESSETIRATCPHCKAVLETESSCEGLRVECPVCKREFVVSRDRPAPVDEKPRSKKKSFIGIVLLVLVAIFVGARCFDGKTPSAASLDAFKVKAVRAAAESFDKKGIQYDARWNGNTFELSIVGDMSSRDLELFVYAGNVDAWHSAKKTFVAMCKAICDAASSDGLDVHVSLNFADVNGNLVFCMYDENITLDVMENLINQRKMMWP